MHITRKVCRAADGVTIVYSACGTGDPALVFIHGGFADRTFWDVQLEALRGRNQPGCCRCVIPGRMIF